MDIIEKAENLDNVLDVVAVRRDRREVQKSIYFDLEAQEPVGVVGSDSTIDSLVVILRNCEEDLYGKLVYVYQPLNDTRYVGIGVIDDIKTSNDILRHPQAAYVLSTGRTIPHATEVRDVRQAIVRLRSSFLVSGPHLDVGDPPMLVGQPLGTSPSTGTKVCLCRDDMLNHLLRDPAFSGQMVTIGKIFRQDLLVPVRLASFSFSGKNALKEALFGGVFGPIGSGKTTLACFLMAGWLRNPHMGGIIFDPQDQISTGNQLVINLPEFLKKLGRKVKVYRFADEIRFSATNKEDFFMDLLIVMDKDAIGNTLSVRTPSNLEALRFELARMLESWNEKHPDQHWSEAEPEEVLLFLLNGLLNSPEALDRIFASKNPRNRLEKSIRELIDKKSSKRKSLLRPFARVFSLFSANTPDERPRKLLSEVLQEAFGHEDEHTDDEPCRSPVVTFLQMQFMTDPMHEESVPIQLSDQMRQILFQEIVRTTRSVAQQRFRENRSLNTLFVVDEAHMFASSEVARKSRDGEGGYDLAQIIRTVRKQGWGWLFISQDIKSIDPNVSKQFVGLTCFGAGLSGEELSAMADIVSPEALKHYRSLPLGGSSAHRINPFLISGTALPWLANRTDGVVLDPFSSADELARHNPEAFGRYLDSGDTT